MIVKVFATLREIVLDKSIEIPYQEKMTVRDLLDSMIRSYPRLKEEIFDASGALKPHVQIFVNGKSIRHLNGLDTTFHPDDEIAMFPPVAGG